MLLPPPDFTIMVIDSAEGLTLVVRHLKELNESDEVKIPAKDTITKVSLDRA